MGMYTELFYRAQLKDDIPEEDKIILNHMFSCDNKALTVAVPDHAFFKTERWSWMVRGCGTFDPIAPSFIDFKKNVIFVHCTIKNYTGEFDGFINWMDQFINELEGSFLGYGLYEEHVYSDDFSIDHIFKGETS